MIQNNEAAWDRVLRVLFGVALATFIVSAGVIAWWATVLLIIGIMVVAFGLVGWCPIYDALGMSTLRPRQAGPPTA